MARSSSLVPLRPLPPRAALGIEIGADGPLVDLPDGIGMPLMAPMSRSRTETSDRGRSTRRAVAHRKASKNYEVQIFGKGEYMSKFMPLMAPVASTTLSCNSTFLLANLGSCSFTRCFPQSIRCYPLEKQ